MNLETVFWVVVIAGAILILWATSPAKSAKVLPFKKPKSKKPERNHLDTIYNPKQFRKPK